MGIPQWRPWINHSRASYSIDAVRTGVNLKESLLCVYQISPTPQATSIIGLVLWQ